MKFERWLGQPVYKLAEDLQDRETQLEGRVVDFSPNSRQFVLRYADGSTEGVSVEEIEDYVPIVRQLSTMQRSPKKRRRAERGAVEATPKGKRTKRLFDSWRDEDPGAPPSTAEDKDTLEAITTFVQGALCPLTSALNVSDDKQQALLAALDKRNEEPLAALARFDDEGEFAAMIDTLAAWATRARECCSKQDQAATPRRTATTSPRRSSSPCGQQSSELMAGTGVSSPKPTKAKEQHISPHPQHTAHFTIVIDLTADPPSDEEEEDDTCSSRRVRFGMNSTIHFRRKDTVDGLLQRAGYKNIKVPPQNPEAWKSALKYSTTW